MVKRCSDPVDDMANELAKVLHFNPDLLNRMDELRLCLWLRLRDAYDAGRRANVVIDMSSIDKPPTANAN
jgi:hypothetical protein